MVNLEGMPGVIYSRKSRKDVEGEREAAAQGKPYDTLEKHRIALLEMAHNYRVHVVEIFEEIVSGEFISERPKMQTVLKMLSSGEIKWVGVMDEDRLGRGDKIDQGRIERAFKESEAYILTPNKIVDMQDEADELYMDYKGMGARYEYKQTKKRLHGGRKRSASRGNYVGARPPFGYLRGIDLKTTYPHLIKNFAEKASDIENLRLYPHPDESEIIVKIFKWFVAGDKMADIIDRLSNETTLPHKSKSFNYKNIHRMLINPVYVGTIRFGNNTYIKLENGKTLCKKTPEEKVQNTEKAHTPLVSIEDFTQAKKRISENNTHKTGRGKELKNPLATLLKCHYCGFAMSYRIYSKINTKRKDIIICPNMACNQNHSIAFQTVEVELLKMINHYYENVVADPSFFVADDNDPSIELKKRKQRIQRQLEEAKSQLDTTYEYLELKVYTLETFLERQTAISTKINTANDELRKLNINLEQEISNKNTIDSVVPRFKNVIETYDDSSSAEEKNNLLKEIIEVIYYAKPGKGYIANPFFNLELNWRDV